MTGVDLVGDHHANFFITFNPVFLSRLALCVSILKRMYGLPRIHLCGKALYPREAIKEWIKNRIVCS